MAKAAPKAAPWLIPNVDAEARGFFSRHWKTVPERAKPHPAMIAENPGKTDVPDHRMGWALILAE